VPFSGGVNGPFTCTDLVLHSAIPFSSLEATCGTHEFAVGIRDATESRRSLMVQGDAAVQFYCCVGTCLTTLKQNNTELWM
jgi:hypothetical protein